MMVAGEEKQGLTWKREGMMVGRALLVRDWGEVLRDWGEGRLEARVDEETGDGEGRRGEPGSKSR